jgi:hypothetical protein
MCPVHTLWDRFFALLPDGHKPWAHVGDGRAREHLRSTLRALKVPDADQYGTHDLRRGHAEDLRRSGATLATILKAGQWKSAAFLNYVNEAQLEEAMHVPLTAYVGLEPCACQDTAFAVVIESDTEEWID